MRSFWLFLADVIRRYHLWLLVLAGVLTVGLALGIPRINFKTGQDTIVPPGSKVFQDNLRYQAQFGGDPMIVLFEGDVRRLLSSPNLEMLDRLDSELESWDSVASVVSPATVVKLSANTIDYQQKAQLDYVAFRQERAAAEARARAAADGLSAAEQAAAAEEASAAVAAEFAAEREADARRFADVGEHSIENPKFVDFIVFDSAGNVRPELQGIIPNPNAALMVVRIAGNMTLDQQSQAAGEMVDLVRSYDFQGLDVTPSGPTVLIKEINDSMRSSMLIMAGLATAIMFIVLAVVFRAQWRLLPLPVVLVGCVWAFGLMGYLSLSLTMVTISGLPILIGLGVDFAIQFHSRLDEERQRHGSMYTALRESMTHLAPVIAVAVLAATVGFLVLHISRVPMIRDFGSMLAVGTVILFLASLVVLNSLLYLRHGSRSEGEGSGQPPYVERVVTTLTRSTVGRVLPLVVVGLLIALVGLIVDSRIPLQTDPEKFIPQDSRVLQDLYHIRDTAGSSSELGIFVEADSVTDPEVLAWMQAFQDEQMALHPELLSVDSIVSLVSPGEGAPLPPEQTIREVLAATPPGIRSTLISEDGTKANVIFSIGNISLGELKDLIDQIKLDLNPPPGVSVTPAGLSVVGVEAVDALAQNRELMIYAAMGAIVLALFVIYRHPIKAVAPMIPIALALGSSSVLLFVLGIELNPLTAVSGPLIIAMGTEFTILLMSRYFEERANGKSPREALGTASLRIGRAITASGLTVIGGFGVLAFSNFPLLENFGKVTALNISLSLLSALVVLPPLLIWFDEEAGWVPVEEKKLSPAE
jgi:hydrophobe/amphiphile efflux-3 (HAE3) family protein